MCRRRRCAYSWARVRRRRSSRSTAPPTSQPPPAASTRCCARSTPSSAGGRRSPPKTNCSPARPNSAASTSSATSTSCGELSEENVAVIGRPDYTVAGLTAAAEADHARRRTPGAGDLPGGDVRRPVRRIRRLPGARRRRATGCGTPSSRGRSRSRRCCSSPPTPTRWPARACRWLPRSSWCSATAPTASYRVDELLPVYLPRRAALQRLLDDHLAGGAPVTWEDEDVRACFRCPECDDPGPRARRPAAGRRHAGQPARPADRRGHHHHRASSPRHDGPVPELSARTVAALTAQARLQFAPTGRRQAAVRGRRRAAADGAARRRTRATCSSTSRATRCGRPTAGSGGWSTCGACSTRRRRRSARSGRTTAPANARRCVDFLAMVRKRRKRYPDMHIYHYAAYEKTTLLRLAGRYGVGEDEVDDLLRNGVLVDLYPVGAQEHSGRHRELQHQVARAALHGRRAAQRRRDHGHRLDHAVRALLRAARRRDAPTRRRSCSRRSRTTTATTAGRRAGCATG